MKLELMTPLKMMYGEHNEPYYYGLIELQNQHVYDKISDIDCILEVNVDRNGEPEPIKIHDIRCYDKLLDEDKSRVMFSEREKIIIEKQIYELIKF